MTGSRIRKEWCNRMLHHSHMLGEAVSVPAYLTLSEVLQRYRGQLSEGTLRNWRSMRVGPSFIKIGKAILYPAEELDRWDRSNLVVCRRSKALPVEQVRADIEAG